MGVTVNLRNVPKLAWIIIAFGIFFLLASVGYSFLQGWSFVQRVKAEEVQDLEKKRLREMYEEILVDDPEAAEDFREFNKLELPASNE